MLDADVEDVLDAGEDGVVLDAGAAEVVVDPCVAELELVVGVVEVLEPIKVWLNASMIACIICEPCPERSARLPPSSSPP